MKVFCQFLVGVLFTPDSLYYIVFLDIYSTVRAFAKPTTMPSVYDFIKEFEYEEMTYSELAKRSPLRDHCLKYDEFNRLFGVTVNIYPENLSEKDHEPPEEVEIWVDF